VVQREARGGADQPGARRRARALKGREQEGAKEGLLAQRRHRQQQRRALGLGPRPRRGHPLEAQQLRRHRDGEAEGERKRHARQRRPALEERVGRDSRLILVQLQPRGRRQLAGELLQAREAA